MPSAEINFPAADRWFPKRLGGALPALRLVISSPAEEGRQAANWTRSSAMTLALVDCGYCSGLGQRLGQPGSVVCGCVYRAVFRACLHRYRDYCNRARYMSRVTLEMIPGRKGRGTWGRKQEEYCADFELIARRALTEFEHRLFRLHFLEGGDWKVCTQRLKMNRGNFFHAVYRVEQKLGRAYRETKPYALHPADEYMNGAMLGVGSCLDNSEGLGITDSGTGLRRSA
jgi:hypothetical protein